MNFTFQRYIDIANETTNHYLNVYQGDITDANNTLKNLYVDNVNMLSFLKSTGRHSEYKLWISKFKEKYPNAIDHIKNHLVIDEEKFDSEQLLNDILKVVSNYVNLNSCIDSIKKDLLEVIEEN